MLYPEKEVHAYNSTAKQIPGVADVRKELSVNLAIGTITLAVSISLLFLVDNFIFLNYSPDITPILKETAFLSYLPPDWFAPEPVERLQFLLSLICTPAFIATGFYVLQKLRPAFKKYRLLAPCINMAGLLLFITYLFVLAP